MKVKIELVSGFLGSGKTSFINAYLNTELCFEKEILIILLEKGVKSIKGDLKNVKVIYIEKIERLKEVLLKEVMEREYSNVIIEFNGTSSLNLIGEIFKDKLVRKKFNFLWKLLYRG